jgi:hypothetical protein
MYHLDCVTSPANLAKTPDPGTPGEIMLLRRGKVKKSQCQKPGSIADAGQQYAASAVTDLGEQNLSFDDRFLADMQRSDWQDTGTILVANRKVKQQVLDCYYPQAAEPVCNTSTDTAKAMDGR